MGQTIPKESQDMDQSIPKESQNMDQSVPKESQDMDQSVPKESQDMGQSIPKELQYIITEINEIIPQNKLDEYYEWNGKSPFGSLVDDDYLPELCDMERFSDDVTNNCKLMIQKYKDLVNELKVVKSENDKLNSEILDKYGNDTIVRVKVNQKYILPKIASNSNSIDDKKTEIHRLKQIIDGTKSISIKNQKQIKTLESIIDQYESSINNSNLNGFMNYEEYYDVCSKYVEKSNEILNKLSNICSELHTLSSTIRDLSFQHIYIDFAKKWISESYYKKWYQTSLNDDSIVPPSYEDLAIEDIKILCNQVKYLMTAEYCIRNNIYLHDCENDEIHWSQYLLVLKQRLDECTTNNISYVYKYIEIQKTLFRFSAKTSMCVVLQYIKQSDFFQMSFDDVMSNFTIK